MNITPARALLAALGILVGVGIMLTGAGVITWGG